jgi:peptidoglycan biosynthesis protein MviN/MurJ (putative lipid II flippase)
VPVAALLIFFAEPILFAWTGKHDIARAAAPILCLYAMGNSCIAIAAFAYYIQYAKGDLKLHFIGQVIYLLSFLPSVIVAATRYGSIGTATVWAVANGLYLLLWVPLVHRRVLPGQHWKWVIRDILPIALPTLSVGWLMSTIVALPADRWWTLGVLAAEGLLLFGIAAGCSSFIRQKLRVPILFQNLVVRKGKI